jgi:hypothetical protein
MTDASATIERIVEAPNWNQRIAQIRLIPQHHGTDEHARIFAEIARLLYLPHLAPDFAYIHEAPFYEEEFFAAAYDAATRATKGFTEISEADLTRTLQSDPRTLLVFRTILGLTREEFAQSTTLAGQPAGLPWLTPAKVDSMERYGSDCGANRPSLILRTDGKAFRDTPPVESRLPPSSTKGTTAEPTGKSLTLLQRNAGT